MRRRRSPNNGVRVITLQRRKAESEVRCLELVSPSVTSFRQEKGTTLVSICLSRGKVERGAGWRDELPVLEISG